MSLLCCWVCSFLLYQKSNPCPDCNNFLTTDKTMQVSNDVGSQYILVDLLDSDVIDCATIIYKTFIKIDYSEVLRKEFYTGSTRTKLLELILIIIEDKGID